MRVGILTLHAQTNYGGVLQAYALQETLRSLGHEVVVIDRWMTEDDGFRQGILSSRSVFSWIKFIVRGVLGLGDFSHLIRCRRTRRLLPKILNLSSYSFYRWKDAPRDLGVDLVIVGSDQVWNPSLLGDEFAYLLKGAPKIPAVAYAASFGVEDLPLAETSEYREGLARFASVSVREKAGARLVNRMGYFAAHVVDPVLLADKSVWRGLCGEPCAKKRKVLCCYLIHIHAGAVIREIEDFATRMDCDVDLFVAEPQALSVPNMINILRLCRALSRRPRSLRLRIRSTPDDFVQSMSFADWVVTDSFHGLMFSLVFDREVRVLSPRNTRGESTFSRLREICAEAFEGQVTMTDMDKILGNLAEGISVKKRMAYLTIRRRESLSWLTTAIKEACHGL